ncbi:hypothetical protein BJ166DRAFT_590598 [Pestalotiopsis sp. NC0098]|nr:hypothetical protein BJ166DRAFT_590598 [Pestalotiopsis sp. NC0098]
MPKHWDGPYWHKEYGLWYKQRTDRHGVVQYEWIGRELPGQQQADPETPRSQVADISSGLENLDIGKSSTYDASGASLPEKQPEYTWKDSDPLVEGTGKGLEDTSFSTDSYEDPYNSGSYDISGAPLEAPQTDYTYPEPSTKGKGKGLDNTLFPTGGYEDSYNVMESGYNVDVGSIPPTYDPTDTYGSYDAPGGSAQDTYRESEQAAERFQRQAGPSSTAPVLDVPLLGGSSRHTIPVAPRRGDNYQVEHSSRWRRGEVIKCWHAEPRGYQDNKKDPTLTHKEERRPQNSMERFYVGPRRFIIVKTGRGRSTCVPISTYSGHGLNKPGITPGFHSVVHSSTTTPRLLPGEPEPGYPPIPVDMTPDELLTMDSRVDYSNLKTFEHNVPVIFIGTVPEYAHEIVANAVNECWEDEQQAAASSSKSKSKGKSKKRR